MDSSIVQRIVPIITKPKITIAMVSYNRPLFVSEAIKSLYRKPGRDDFEFLVWDNGSEPETQEVLVRLQKHFNFELLLNKENIGQQALHELLENATGDYFVITEDDMIWFQDDWLKLLVEAFEQEAGVTDIGQNMGFKNEWGILATNVMVDRVNNGGMWEERFRGMIEQEVHGVYYWTNIKAGAGAMIMRTKLVKLLDALPAGTRPFGNTIDFLINRFDRNKYPMAQLRDVYIYHAASPFFNQLYPKVWHEKHGNQTIEDGFQIYNDLGQFEFDKHQYILELLKQGKFSKYAKKLFKIFDNGRGRIYSFKLARKIE